MGDPQRVPAITPDSRNRAKPKSAEQNTIIISNAIYNLHTSNTDKYEEKYWLSEVSMEAGKRQDL